MTNRTKLLDALRKMQPQQEAISKHVDVENLPENLQCKLRDMCSNVRMVDWFASRQPDIWPIEMRMLLASKYYDEHTAAARAAGYKPKSDLAKRIFDLRTRILAAKAEASAVPWETTNDAALFVALRNMECTATWIIKDVDIALNALSRKEGEP